jgi:Holliday junction resolvasome RuvABC DNA-binding subunit
LATVRIYKVAELLYTSSQEVLALLKRAQGIGLKTAERIIATARGEQVGESAEAEPEPKPEPKSE